MTPDDDLTLLRKILAQGGKKYTAGHINRTKYQRLVEFGWLTAIPQGTIDVLYEVTPNGRHEAAQPEHHG